MINMKNRSSVVYIVFALVSIIAIIPIANAAPLLAANFSANVTSGTTPLSVGFTDLTTGTPMNWSWYFGDEPYTQTWVQVNAGAGWTADSYMGIARLPNGHIVLTGGYNSTGTTIAGTNDTWQSTDNGAHWTLMNPSSGWLPRWNHGMVALSDGTLVLMGGANGTISTTTNYYNDTWQSTDEGAHWTRVNASSGWETREAFPSVAMPDDSIILTGGASTEATYDDTWRSTDKGATWTEVNAGGSWERRWRHTSNVLPDGSIVIIGGLHITQMNDTWRSTNNGATWTQVSATAGWPARGRHNTVAMPDGNIVLMGGDNGTNQFNDMWLSKDKGATWSLLHASSGWSARYGSRSTLTSNGTVLIMGGRPNDYKDVWSFNPIGSPTQSPSHVYSAAGNYSVALLVHSATDTNSTLKVEYINVTTPGAPVANFTGFPLSGIHPLTVTFTDTSTGVPTSWAWTFGDGNTTNATMHNPIHTYYTAGNFTVSLNATNAVGSNIVTKTQYINVTNATDKIGVYNNGVWYLDHNGNGTWDGAGIDKYYNFGGPGNVSVVGDWNGDGKTEIGVTNGVYWYLDDNGNGVWDGTGTGNDKYGYFGISGYTPVVGDWNGDGKTEIGVTNGVYWYLDDNGNGVWDGTGTGNDKYGYFGITGYTPVVGNWSGDVSRTRIGVTNGVYWYLDDNGNGVWDGTGTGNDTYGYFGISGYTPVVGDWNGDGKTEIGVTNSVDWFLDSNGNGTWDGPTVDKHGYFGITGWTPVVGKW